MTFGKSKDSSEIATASSTAAASTSSGKVEALLGRNSKIIGKVIFNGPAELDGNIEGEIEATDKLIIGESAVINAKISGTEIIVRGQVNGDIIATKRLALHKQAKVIGSITGANLSIEEGAILDGKCTMNGSGSDTLKKNSDKLTSNG